MLNSRSFAAFDQLQHEHIALTRHYGAVQKQCSQLLQSQRADIARLEAEVMRLRAAVLLRDTALAVAREDRADFEASIPGLPRRAVLARRVDALLARIQLLMRERLHWQWHAQSPVVDKSPAAQPDTTAGDSLLPHALAEPGRDPDDQVSLAELEASLVAADLVICQTGCLSHGAYWRVQDYCKRTGKTCVLVDQPQVIRIVRGLEAVDRVEARPA